VDENQKIFPEKGKLGKFSRTQKFFLEIRGKSKTGGNASLPQRGWTPLALRHCFERSNELSTPAGTIDSKVDTRGVHPPEAMMHSPRFRFPPYFRKILGLSGKFKNLTLSRKNFPFSSAKISDDLFLVIDHKFRISPYFPCFSAFPPWFAKNYYSPYFSKSLPVLKKFNNFLHTLRVFFHPTLTMMHLCITQCTYWTPLVHTW